MPNDAKELPSLLERGEAMRPGHTHALAVGAARRRYGRITGRTHMKLIAAEIIATRSTPEHVQATGCAEAACDVHGEVAVGPELGGGAGPLWLKL